MNKIIKISEFDHSQLKKHDVYHPMWGKLSATYETPWGDLVVTKHDLDTIYKLINEMATVTTRELVITIYNAGSANEEEVK